MTYKSIFSGRLEFGTARSFEKVVQMFEHRKENYYRMEIIFNAEDIFFEDQAAMDIPRFITHTDEKGWRNTINMLKNIAEFAVAGDLNAWMIDNGKILKKAHIEPQSDKSAVMAYLKGRELVKESGREAEAKVALSRAIEKFERHALAYERRGFVNFRLNNFEDALYDYSKSIDINPRKAEPYLGRAIVKITQSDPEGAIDDLKKATENSIPLQTIYWNARRIMADQYLKLKDYPAAIKELKLFTKRNFPEDNSNFEWRKTAFFTLGKALAANEQHEEALAAFSAALKIEAAENKVSNTEIEKYMKVAKGEIAQAVH